MQDEKTSRPQNHKSGNAVLLAIVIAFIIIAAGAGYYWMNLAQQAGGNGGSGEEGVLESAQAVALLGALEKQGTPPEEYVIGFSVDNIYGQKTEVVLKKSKTGGFAAHKTNIYEEQYYFEGDAEIVCVGLPGAGQRCARVAGDAPLKNRTAQLKEEFLTGGGRGVEETRKLITSGKIVFSKNISAKEVAGRNCTSISYKYATSVDIERCFDNEFGIVLKGVEKYMVENESAIYGTEYSVFEAAGGVEITAPKPDASESEVASLLAAAARMEAQAAECLGDIGPEGAYDKCIFKIAVDNKDARICIASKYGKNLQTCIIRMVVAQGQPEYCRMAGSAQDDCYFEYAYAKEDASYCSLLADAGRQEGCKNSINEKSAAAGGAN